MGLRLGMLLLVCCVGLQGIAVSAQRAGGRLHHHIPVAQHAGHGDGHGASHQHAHDFDHQDDDHDHDHGHDHPDLADHGHELGDRSVVHVVDGDQDTSPSQPAPPLRAHDLDGLLIRVAVVPDPGGRDRWPREAALVIRSFVSSPLERPPSA